MKKLFLFSVALLTSLMVGATTTIVIDGDNSEWTDIPMLSKPGEFPIIKVATAADAEIGEGNALVYMIQSDVELDQTWEKYPNMFLDKDYNINTNPIECWQYTAMGVDYKATTGVQLDKWVSFTKAISAHVIEIAIPSSYVTDLQSKFGIAFYYGSELWYSPQYNTTDYPEISSRNGWLYKHRTISDLCGIHTADKATTHQSIGDATTTIDFGARAYGYDTALWAAWPVSMETPIQVKVSADVASTNGWELQCYLVDMKTNAVVDTTNFSSQSAFTGTKELGKWDLTSHPAGSYMLMLKNRTAYSRVQVNSITLEYAGGAVVDIPETLPIADAILSSGASRVEGYIDFASESNDNARWNIHVPGAIGTKVTIDVKNASGHRYYVYVYDKDNQLVKMVRESSWNETEGVQELGSVAFPAEGNYYVIVADSSSGSSAVFKDLTFASAGGAVVDIPGTLPVADAILSSGASINEDGYITYHDAGTDNARWNINATKAGSMSVAMDVVATDGHTYMVALYSMEGDSITAVKEKGWTAASGIMNLVGTIAIPQAGNYYVVVKNMVSGSHATFNDVTFTYAGGAVVAIQGTLPIEDAVMNGNRVSKTETEISWNNSSDDASSYVTWNVNATKIGQYDVILNENTEVGHNYTVSLMNGSETLTSVSEGENVWKQGEINLGKIVIEEEGSYTIKLTNTTFNSSSKVTSLSLNYLGGGVVTIPGTLLPADAMLSEKAFIDNDTIFFAPRGSEGYTPEGWAKWNVTLEKDMLCSFRANCFKDNSMSIKISILDEDNNIIYDKIEKLSGSGDIEANLGDTILKAGNYVIQMEDTTMFSNGRLLSVVVEGTPVLVITDDSNIDFTDYAGQTVNVQLKRTFKANMYNPICLPFALSSAALQNILKSEKSYVLRAATLEGQKLYVELQEGNDIYQGTPNMIKPSEDVENPVFTNVKIETISPDQTTRGVLRLQGSFASHTIDNSQTALLVGANNTLFFPNDETPYIKSMRAYFILVGQAAGAPIKAACFREPGNAPTWMEVQNAECTMHNGKVIRDGRFVIVRDGKEYNAQGIEL